MLELIGEGDEIPIGICLRCGFIRRDIYHDEAFALKCGALGCLCGGRYIRIWPIDIWDETIKRFISRLLVQQ